MAWVTPRTWTTGDVVTAAFLNQDLRDNPLFLYTPPMCRPYDTNATISIATSGTIQAVTYNDERFDTDTMHNTAANTSRITFTTAGKYMVGGCVQWASGATGVREVSIRSGGSVEIVQDDRINLAASAFHHHVNTIYHFSAADYAEFMCRQTQGTALNIVLVANISNEAWAFWIGN